MLPEKKGVSDHVQSNDYTSLPLVYPAAIFLCPPQEMAKDLEPLIANIHREFSMRTSDKCQFQMIDSL
jgi:hypothetical protein